MALQQQRIYTNYQYYTAFYLDWSEEWISGGAENYSNISWRVGIHASGGNPGWYSNSVKILSSNLGGNGLTTGTWSNINLTNGSDRQLGNGGFNYGHDSAGDAVISGSIQGWLYNNGNSTTASGSWWLTHINRYAVINSTQGNFTDESTNTYINYSNPGGGGVTAYMYIRPTGSTGAYTLIASRGSYVSATNFSLTSGEIDTALGVLAGASSGQVLMRVANSVGNTDALVTMSVINADPTFTAYTYKDNNATTAALTGNNQVIIQDPGGLTYPTSSLLVTVLAANKAVPKKFATMVDYLFTMGLFSDSAAFSGASTVTKSIGSVNLSGTQTLQVAARDSRGKSTSVNTGITILPYAMPMVAAHLSRSNNFDAAVRLTFDAMQISSLVVGGTKKNGIKSTSTGTANNIEYRYMTDAGSYGTWINVTASVGADSGGVAPVTATALDIVASPTANHTYTAQVRVTDTLNNATTLTVYLSSGQPIFRIGTDSKVYNNENLMMVSHVGMVIMSTTQTTGAMMADLYGGTWTAWGTGRVPVGFDGGQTEFDTIEKTGGAKTHTLTTAQIPSHRHNYNLNLLHSDGAIVTAEYVNTNLAYGTIRRRYYDVTEYEGGGGSHNNLQPYITCYFWKRTV